MEEAASNTLLINILYEKEVKNVMSNPPGQLLMSECSTEPDGCLNSSCRSSTSTDSSSSSSDSSSSHRSEKSISQGEISFAYKKCEWNSRSLYVITRVPGRLSHLIWRNDILCKIGGKHVTKLPDDVVDETLQNFLQRPKPVILTVRRWKSDDVMKEISLQINTKLVRREVRYIERTTKKPKPKLIQIDFLGNQYAYPDKDKIIAKPIEDCEKKSSYYFYIWTFKCFVIMADSKLEPRVGFTCTYELNGKKYDLCSDLSNASTGHYLTLKPHSDVSLQSIDERFFLINELTSKRKVIESLPFKDVYVAYSKHCCCLTMNCVKHISDTNVNSLVSMFTQNTEVDINNGPCANETSNITRSSLSELDTNPANQNSQMLNMMRYPTWLCCFVQQRNDDEFRTELRETKLDGLSYHVSERTSRDKNGEDVLSTEFLSFVDPGQVKHGVKFK